MALTITAPDQSILLISKEPLDPWWEREQELLNEIEWHQECIDTEHDNGTSIYIGEHLLEIERLKEELAKHQANKST